MNIKRNPKEMKKRFWMFGALIGVCVVIVSGLYFFHKEKGSYTIAIIYNIKAFCLSIVENLQIIQTFFFLATAKTMIALANNPANTINGILFVIIPVTATSL